MYHLIVYSDLSNPYMRLIRVADGGIVAAADWSISKATTWDDSDIALTHSDLIGGIPIELSEDLAPGDYDLLIYDAASPADTDSVQIGKRIAWDGHQLMGLPMSL